MFNRGQLSPLFFIGDFMADKIILGDNNHVNSKKEDNNKKENKDLQIIKTKNYISGSILFKVVTEKEVTIKDKLEKIELEYQLISPASAPLSELYAVTKNFREIIAKMIEENNKKAKKDAEKAAEAEKMVSNDKDSE